jgi:G3E family GTPase
MPPDETGAHAADLLSGQRQIDLLILTGFLGAGKTTLLNRLLADESMRGCVVLMNELGEVAIDHLVVREIRENVVLLRSGCVCCAVRDDMVHALRELHVQALRGDLPGFDRVILETTGIADPVPIVHTVMTDPFLLERYSMRGTVACVDAVNGQHQLLQRAEARNQAIVADMLVVTKLDLAGGSTPPPLLARLGMLNPGVDPVSAGDLTAAHIFRMGDSTLSGGRWVERARDRLSGLHHRSFQATGPDLHAVCISLPSPVDMVSLSGKLEGLLAAHGEAILRTKGIVRVSGHPRPLVLNGVHHVFYPTTELANSDDLDAGTLVFLVDGSAGEIAEVVRRIDWQG